MTAAEKRDAQLARDMQRAHERCKDQGPLHIHRICSMLRIPRKSQRARALYLGIKGAAEQGQGWQRAPIAASHWQAV